MDTMYFSWLSDSPIELDEGVEMPQFTLQKWELNDCSQSYTAGTIYTQSDMAMSWVMG